MVQIQKQQRCAQVVTFMQRCLLAQAVHQQCAVWQVGQRVMVGQVSDLGLGSFKLAYVAGGEQQAGSVINGDRFDGYFDVDQVAASGASQDFPVADTALFLDLVE